MDSMDMNKATPREWFTRFNILRRKHLGSQRDLKWKRWKIPVERALKKADGDGELLLDAWLMYLTHPVYKWWREVPTCPTAAFLRPSKIDEWLCAVEEMKAQALVIGHEPIVKADTSTLGLATTFWMKNRRDAGQARSEGEQAFVDYLELHCSHPMNVVSLLTPKAVKK